MADAPAIERLFRRDELHDRGIVRGAFGHGRFDQGRGEHIEPNILRGVIRSRRFG